MTNNERQRTTEDGGRKTNVLRNLGWFVFVMILAIIAIQYLAWLGLVLAIIGGGVLGAFITREVRA